MAIEANRIAKNTGLLYFRMLLLLIVSLYTSRVILAALGAEDYGIYNVVGGVVAMIGFLRGTMSTASSRFVAVSLTYEDLSERRKVFSNIFIVNLLFALLVIVVAESIGIWFLLEKMTIPSDRMDAALWVYQLSIITVALGIITVPYNACIIAHERMGAFAYISLFDAFAKLTIAFLISHSTYDRLIIYAVLMMVVSLLDVSIYVFYCLRRFPESKLCLKANKDLIKNVFSFIGWASYGSFVSMGFTQGLNIILNIFFNPVVNAARAIAVQVQSAVSQFSNNFQTAINPQMIKSMASKNYSDTRRLCISSSKMSFYIMCVIGIPLLLNMSFILKLWLVDVPEYTAQFCMIVLCIGIWESLAYPLRVINQAEGNIRNFQLIEGTFLLLIVPISYAVLKIWAIPLLVFVVHLTIELSCQLIRIRLVTYKFEMPFMDYVKEVYLKIFPAFILPLLAVVFFDFFVNTTGWAHLILTTAISEIILGLVVFFYGLNIAERRFLTRLLPVLRSKK